MQDTGEWKSASADLGIDIDVPDLRAQHTFADADGYQITSLLEKRLSLRKLHVAI
jgi:hypothetical protein